MPALTASAIQITVNQQTHDTTISDVQTFPDGHQAPLQLHIGGTRYDATAALCAAMVAAVALQNGCVLTPAQIASYAGQQGVTTPQIVAYIQANLGPILSKDVARFWAEIENLLNLPDAPPSAPVVQSDTAPDISL